MGMLEDLTELLLDLNVDMDDVTRGPLTDTPVDQTALIPYPRGESPGVYAGIEYESHGVAVQVRRADGVEARNHLQEIHDAVIPVVDQEAGDSLFHRVIPQSTPGWIDEDANGASVYGLNLEVRRTQV